MKTAAIRNVAALGIGTLFGFGLALSEMVNPVRVLGFLDIFGDWDPTLLLVMVGAVTVTLITFRWVLRQPHPLLSTTFHTPTKTIIDRELVMGAAIFGVGWGMAGYCPGPALAGLGFGLAEQFVFVAAMLIGGLVQRRTRGLWGAPKPI